MTYEKFTHKHHECLTRYITTTILSILDRPLWITGKIDRFKLNCMYREYKLQIVARLSFYHEQHAFSWIDRLFAIRLYIAYQDVTRNSNVIKD